MGCRAGCRALQGSLLAMLLAVVLLAMACPSRASARSLLQRSETVLKGKSIVVSRDMANRASTRELALRDARGNKFQVQLAADVAQTLEGLTTGMNLEIRGRWSAGPEGPELRPGILGGIEKKAMLFAATSLQASGGLSDPLDTAGGNRMCGQGSSLMACAASAAAQDTVNGATITISTNKLITPSVNTLFIPIVAVDAAGRPCPGTGRQPKSMAELKSLIFEESNPAGPTVGGTFRQCSFNKTFLNSTNSRIASVVRLPCSGTTNGNSWTFSKCAFADYNGWSDAADEVLAKRKALQLSQFKYRVYLLPPCTACGDLAGLGYVGCDGSYECRAWIGGGYWDDPQASIHELGHNLFMGHAGATFDGQYDGYGDESSVQGYCCSNRCWDTAHAWQMGWLSVQNLNQNSLRPGQTVAVNLPTQATSARSGLRVEPGWAPGVPSVFVGYRTPVQADSGLLGEYANKVNIYTAAFKNRLDAADTHFQAALSSPGESWSLPEAGLTVRLRARKKAAAVISVCRYGGPETAESCAAGRDNDCNGWAGAKDPACVLF